MAHMEHAPLLRTDAIEDSDYEAFHNFPFTKDQDFFVSSSSPHFFLRTLFT